jgi:hypothetical protein
VELLFGAEDQLPGVRVHTVGPDHDVERTPAVSAEGDVDAVDVLVEGVDGVAEHELHIVPDRGVEGVGEVSPPYLQIASPDAAGDGMRVERDHLAAVAVQEKVNRRRSMCTFCRRSRRPIRRTTSSAVPRTSMG